MKAPMSNRPFRFALLQSAAALALSASCLCAQTPPDAGGPTPPSGPNNADARPPHPDGERRRAPRHEPAATQPFSGTVQAYNYSPRGTVDGFVLKTNDGIAQMNVPPDMGATISSAVAIGDSVTLTARPLPPGQGPGDREQGPRDRQQGPRDHGQGPRGNDQGPRGNDQGPRDHDQAAADHPVYLLATLTPAKGDMLTIAGPDDWHVTKLDATVKQLNYDREGHVNGALLDTGDLLHVAPASADAASKLTVGQTASIEGFAHPTPTGHKVIEATNLNGTAIHLPNPPSGGPEDRADRPEGDRGPRGPRMRRGDGQRPPRPDGDMTPPPPTTAPAQ